MPDSSLDILFEHESCLAVVKPAGILTQAPPGIDSLEVRIKRYLAQGDDLHHDVCLGEVRLGRDVYLGVVHRLDRPVSGAMVFCKSRRAARRLSKQFQRRTVKKTYWACVEGEVDPTEGSWRDPMRKIPDIARAEIVSEDHPDAHPAVLHYEALGRTPYGSWLEIALETGRYHQIRLQASVRGFPLLGDAMYGSRIPFGVQHEDPRLRAIALHARTLSFLLPETKEPVSVTAELTADWQALELPS